MKCPILQQVWLPPGEKGKWQPADCIMERCAWYDANADRCAVLEVSKLLNAIGNTLGVIAKELTLHRPRGG